jgi:putative spermidine/putrescine transport system substrate-binding protein
MTRHEPDERSPRGRRTRSTRRRSSALALAGVLALVGAACGDDDDDDDAGTATTGAATGDTGTAETTGGEAAGGDLEGAVSIIAWAGYIEDGTNDPAYDWVTPFETETGCEVSVTTAGTSDEMVSLMTGSDEYDLVTASGDASNRLIAGGTVQPVDLSRIPSYASVDPRLQDAPWYTVGDEHYGVPYQWGSNVLMYNTEVFPEPPTSWDVVFVPMDLPDGESNEGRVQAYDGPIYIADAALYLMAHEPDLGITDPYALTQEQFDAAIELLQGQRQLVARYWHDVTVQVDDFTNEGTVASSSWPYQVNTLVAAGAPIASTVPEEGATGWADTTMLATNAQHPNCAYAWMEWSLDPVVQGDVAAWFGSVPANPAGCDASENLGTEGCATNGIDNFDQIHFWKTPEGDCFGAGSGCVPYSTWTEEYQAVMSG